MSDVVEYSGRRVDGWVLSCVAPDFTHDDVEELQRSEEGADVAARSSRHRYKLESEAVTPNDAAELVFQVLAYGMSHTLEVAHPELLAA